MSECVICKNTLVALNQQVHHGAPNGSYDMTAIMKMHWAVKEAQKNAMVAKLPMPVEDWLLRNWRVPAGVEKSADQVAHILLHISFTLLADIGPVAFFVAVMALIGLL